MKIINSLLLVISTCVLNLPAYGQDLKDLSAISTTELVTMAKADKNELLDLLKSNKSCTMTDLETTLMGKIEVHASGLFSSLDLDGWIKGQTKLTGQAVLFICEDVIPSKISEEHYNELKALYQNYLSGKATFPLSRSVIDYGVYLLSIMKNKDFGEKVIKITDHIKVVMAELENRMFAEELTKTEKERISYLQGWCQGMKIAMLKHNPDKPYNSHAYGPMTLKFKFVEDNGCKRFLSYPPCPRGIYIYADADKISKTFAVVPQSRPLGTYMLNTEILDFLLSNDNAIKWNNYAVEPFAVILK